MTLSATLPGNPQGFRAKAWICEHDVAAHGTPRKRILDSFQVTTRPSTYYRQFMSVKGVTVKAGGTVDPAAVKAGGTVDPAAVKADGTVDPAAVKADGTVDPAAVEAGAEIVAAMLLGRQDLARCMARSRAGLAIIPRDRTLTSLPDYAHLKGTVDFTGRTPLANEPNLVLGASVPKEMVIINAEDEEDETKLDVLGDTQSQWAWIPGMPHRYRDWDVHETDDEMIFEIVLHPPEVMADLLHWNERLQKEDRLSSPLFPLINAFLKRPMPVEPNRRPARIMPSRIAMARDSDRRVPERFSPPAHVQRTKGGEMLIHGFESVQAPSPALPLALYDLGGGPNDGKGEGAPLALRIFVESILALPREARNGQRREVQISLREFLSWIGIDNPDALRRQSRYLDQVRRAIEALDKAWIPIYNPIMLLVYNFVSS